MAIRTVFLLLLTSCFSFAQNELDDAFEFWNQYQNEESNPDVFTATLEPYLNSPLQINNANSEQLRSFPLFKEKQIDVLQQYLSKYDNILLLEELAQLPFFNDEFVSIIQPFISLKKRKYIPRASFETISRLNYDPNSNHSYSLTRLKYSRSKIKMAVIHSKAYNESLFDINNLLKASLTYQPTQFLKATIGTHNLHVGEGLIHSNGYRFNTSQFQKNTSSLNSSSSATNFQQGVTTEFNFKNHSHLISLSRYHLLDATENDIFTHLKRGNTWLKTNQNFTSLIQSSTYKRKVHSVSLNHKLSWFSSPFQPKPTYYNYHYQLPKRLTNHSLSYHYFHPDIELNGEVAISNNAGVAYIQSLNTYPTEYVEINLIGMYITPNYQSFESNSYQNNNRLQNETGFRFEFIFGERNFNIKLQHQFSKFPYPKYLFHSSSSKQKTRLSLKKSIGDSIYLNIRVTYAKSRKEISSQTTFQLSPLSSFTSEGNCRFVITENLKFITRFGFNHFTINKAITEGFYLAQDLIYKRKKFNYSMRFAIINCEDWDNRFYVYEYDMLHNFSVPVYHNQKFRTYLNLGYKFNDKWQGWLKAGLFYDYIKNYQTYDCKFQIRYKP